MTTPPGERLTLASKADLAAATALHAQLSAARGDVVVDASDVSVLTTPIAQVLLAAGDAIRADGGTLTLADPSDAALRCLSELGLTPYRIERGPTSAAGVA